MTTYQEEDYLQLSGIQHFAFCPRQWALIHIDMLWAENLRTVEGNLLHEKCHDGYSSESRGEVVISRGMPVFSREMGVSGECDVVELRKSKTGVSLFGREGFYTVYPVEYKRGEPKSTDIDIVQLAAQAICLEEMLGCEIKEGALFYGRTKRRQKVTFSNELKARVREAFLQMHEYHKRGHVPKVKMTKACNACSLKDLCLPKMNRRVSAKKYLIESVHEMGESP
ncbi:MAG: CRISPR-associated protein Cas4 [Oscillospiraceae bacterium]|jgi:CRISPR-associated exonuclease Cas4|nr:CRISPR-associated protein Cas4 [Oscillospiraceae bacterium]